MSWLERKNRKATDAHIQCPKCGRWNSKYRSNCWNCGEEL
jgi:uncharacterized OB-fold protein